MSEPGLEDMFPFEVRCQAMSLLALLSVPSKLNLAPPLETESGDPPELVVEILVRIDGSLLGEALLEDLAETPLTSCETGFAGGALVGDSSLLIRIMAGRWL